MKTWLFNPFKFIAGGKALMLGASLMAVTAVTCYLLNVHLDGTIDLHKGKETANYLFFIEPIIDWLCLILPLYFFGRILSGSSIRFIDMAGTMALARGPMLFAVIISMLMPKEINDPTQLMHVLQTDPHLIIQFALLGLLTIPCIVWTVALMYNGYALSANLKSSKAVWSFIVSFLIAEVASKIIIANLN